MVTAQERLNDAQFANSHSVQATARAFGAQVIYVKWNAVGLNNGSSWVDAFPNLQDAFVGSPPGSEIWVAAGTYRPDLGVNYTPGDQGAFFNLPAGVGIYGGFAGNETSRDQRNWTTNVTILSGDLLGDDLPVPCTVNLPDCAAFGLLCDEGSCIISSNNADNSFALIRAFDWVDGTNILDGLTITGASSDGGMVNQDASPTIANCTFKGNLNDFGGGGGLQNTFSSAPSITNCLFHGNSDGGSGGGMGNNESNPVVTNCTFFKNSAFGSGGGMFNFACSPTVTNCTFSGNYSNNNTFGGGGVANVSNSSPTLINCDFSGNSALRHGGGLYQGIFVTMTNCTFSGNVAGADGGGVYLPGAPTKNLSNCIFWGNADAGGADESAQIYGPGGGTVVNYSIVQGGWTGPGGTGNSALDPRFVDADGTDNVGGTLDDNLQLNADSPAIDAGNDASVPPDTRDLDGDGNTSEPLPIDRAGNDRFIGLVDMGAYEFSGPCEIERKLTASDAVEGDWFGYTVSVSGDTAVVGSRRGWPPGGPNPGSAYVYVRTGGGWIQQQKLTPSDSAAGDMFGVFVSVNGDTAAISGSGAVYVFVRSGTVWTQQQKLIPLDAAVIGVSSVNGDTVVAGATNNSAYVFVRSGAVWTQQQKLTASDGAASDQFGVSVSVDGETVVVGADLDNSPATDAGSAYVFTRSGTVWTQQQKLTASDALPADNFGFSVSISGNTAVVGAWGNGDSGAAYVYLRSGAVWAQQQKLTASDAEANDVFAYSVSVDGDIAVVSADSGDDACPSDPSCNSGSAYVFKRAGTVWTEDRKLTAADAAQGDLFGISVSVSGNTVVAGAIWHDDDVAGEDSGSAYVFDLGCAIEPDAPLPDPSGISKGRAVSIVPPAPAVAAMGDATLAIRVKLISLHHVNPPYTGGPSIPFTSFEGQVRWVGPPAQYVESSASQIPFYAAQLQCTPHYQDWSTVGLLHVTGSAITPSSIYEVENLAASCVGIEDTCTAVSAPLEIVTTRWGDVRSPYNPPDPSVQPDISDVSALVDKFRNAPGAPIKARGLLAGAPGNAFGEITHEVLNVDFGFSHISACVDAYRGAPYPYAISACP